PIPSMSTSPLSAAASSPSRATATPSKSGDCDRLSAAGRARPTEQGCLNRTGSARPARRGRSGVDERGVLGAGDDLAPGHATGQPGLTPFDEPDAAEDEHAAEELDRCGHLEEHEPGDDHGERHLDEVDEGADGRADVAQAEDAG